MMLSFEINESENNGDGKVTAIYKVGVSKATKTASFCDDDLAVFNTMLDIMQKRMWGGDLNSAKHHIESLADIFNIKKRDNP